MAKTKSTRERARSERPKKKPAHQLERLLPNQPAQLTEEDVITIERRAAGADENGHIDATIRRLALGSLARPGQQLIDSVTANRETAVATATMLEQFILYARRLRSLADMMESASLRLSLSLCYRDDMSSVLEEASLVPDLEVGHG